MKAIFTGAAAAILAGCLAAPLPATAKGVTELSACMWVQMPASSAAFVDNRDSTKDFSLMMKAVAPCGDDLPTNLPLPELKKQLAATRPAVIGADHAGSDNVAVCKPAGSGAPACKPAGD